MESEATSDTGWSYDIIHPGYTHMTYNKLFTPVLD